MFRMKKCNLSCLNSDVFYKEKSYVFSKKKNLKKMAAEISIDIEESS